DQATAPVGDTVTSTITPSIPGDDSLTGNLYSFPTRRSSALGCSNFSPAVPATFTLTKAGTAGASRSFTCTHVLQDTDPNPYVNVACFDAHDALGGQAGTFADTCGDDTTTIVHPGFTLTKKADKAT